ncbi:hypothetical protein ACOZ4L_05710 [Haloplanus ruber]|uniref:Uncharacterized protein n=1 Tax=Haloplanus ruber TaxID=869892 RepID=A0ABD6CVG9_9EURY|nr:hypothetical protein [Haloplanus ruber]
MLVPCPDPDDAPFNETVSAVLSPGQKLTAEFTPEQSETRMFLPILAVSKYPEMSYQAKADGENIYGPSRIPPTDVDDLSVTFIPAKSFEQSLTVEVSNLSTNTDRFVIVQPVGWEVV